jgi:hypothetical protein
MKFSSDDVGIAILCGDLGDEILLRKKSSLWLKLLEYVDNAWVVIC